MGDGGGREDLNAEIKCRVWETGQKNDAARNLWMKQPHRGYHGCYSHEEPHNYHMFDGGK